MSHQNVLILSALPEELSQIASILSDTVAEDVFGLKVNKGQYKNLQVITALSGMGKVQSAMNTERLICKYSPSLIIFSGVAGAINPELNIGDIVIADRTFQHDFGFYSNSILTTNEVGTMPQVGYGESKNIYLSHDVKKYIDLSEIQKNHSEQLIFGTIATGDQFIADKKRKKQLKELEADAVEMEGASVAFVAKQNNVPIILIRSISDTAEGIAVEDFPKFFKDIAQNTKKIISHILTKVGKHPSNSSL